MVVPETLFILNENGGRIELPLYMDEEGSFIKIKRQKRTKSLSYLQAGKKLKCLQISLL